MTAPRNPSRARARNWPATPLEWATAAVCAGALLGFGWVLVVLALCL